MIAIPKILRRLRVDRRGATAIEYGLICAMIVIAMTVGLAKLGSATSGSYTNIANKMP